MENKINRKLGIVFMTLGVMLLLGAVLFTLQNMKEDRNAEIQSRIMVQELQKHVLPAKAPEFSEALVEQIVLLEGYDCLGILEIPKLNLSLPVLSQWSTAGSKLAVCRYSGSYLSNDMIIAGHNYKAHFAALNRLEQGDTVIFTDVNAVKYQYQVERTEVIDGSEVEKMIFGNGGLTLFTCTTGGEKRFTARCVPISPDNKIRLSQVKRGVENLSKNEKQRSHGMQTQEKDGSECVPHDSDGDSYPFAIIAHENYGYAIPISNIIGFVQIPTREVGESILIEGEKIPLILCKVQSEPERYLSHQTYYRGGRFLLTVR